MPDAAAEFRSLLVALPERASAIGADKTGCALAIAIRKIDFVGHCIPAFRRAARRADSLPVAAIGAVPGEHDANGARPETLGGGSAQSVDRRAVRIFLRPG